MGTKGSYSGSAAGGEVRDGLDDWLASLPGGDSTAPAPVGSQPTLLSPLKPSPNSPAGRILPTTALFRSSRSGGGNSRGRRSTDTLTRSVSGSARSAGRGAAAAYAYRTGDAQTLRNLGLDYDALRANPNVFDVAHQIAQKVCEDLPPGTIETAEQMEVVGRLAEWLVESETTGTDVTLGQIAEEAVALSDGSTRIPRGEAHHKNECTGPAHHAQHDSTLMNSESMIRSEASSPPRPK